MSASHPSTGSLPGVVRAPQACGFRVLRWFIELSLFGKCLLVLGVLFALICVLFAEENWRGRRAWENCRRDLEARGVQLDWAKFIPPPVPDEQNFAMTPFLAPLLDFNPKPRLPGQSAWRDQEGHDRAVNFAAVLLPTDKQGQVLPTRFDGQMTDFEGALALLRSQTNKSSGATTVFANRAQAGSALLDALEEYRPVLDELRSASMRPHSRFNLEYASEDFFSILLPHYLVLHRAARVLELRASAELALGKTADAFEDAKLICNLADAVKDEPFLVSLKLRGSMMKLFEQIVWEGLVGRSWCEPQLQDFQARLAAFQVLKELKRILDAERAGFGETAFRFMRTHKNILRNWISYGGNSSEIVYLLAGPNGWLYQEQVSYHRLFDRYVLNGFDAGIGRVHPGSIRENRVALGRELAGSSFWHHTGLSKLTLEYLTKSIQQRAIGQNRADQAVLACALERYRLANGSFPETLGVLVPQFVDKVPQDVCDGQPLRYRRLQNGSFQLYSVGWNEKDDGGSVVTNKDGSDFDPDQGDWVWGSEE